MKYLNPRVRAAYAECRKLATRHYENFPVASWLVPSDKRDALAVIYAFARCADDFADEPDIQDRLAALGRWRSNLDRCLAGKAENPVFVALSDVIQTFSLRSEHFEKLLCAFESDVRVNRHPDFAALLAYCRNSANPVGRLVLEVFGHRDPELFALSDSICTALQLTNFWQDAAIDLGRDRIYVPIEDLARFGLSVTDLQRLAVSSNGMPWQALFDRWRALMVIQVRRTRELFEHGRLLPERVAPELRCQLRLTWLGGTAILSRIESAGYDVFRRRPSLAKTDFVRLYLRARRALPLEAPPTASETSRI
jgi:squalene synthase HpnC